MHKAIADMFEYFGSKSYDEKLAFTAASAMVHGLIKADLANALESPNMTTETATGLMLALKIMVNSSREVEEQIGKWKNG